MQEGADLPGDTLPARPARRVEEVLVDTDAADHRLAAGPLVVRLEMDLDVHPGQQGVRAGGVQDGGGAAQRVEVEPLDELRVAPVEECALAVGAGADVELAVFEVDVDGFTRTVLDGHPEPEVGQPFGSVVTAPRRLRFLQAVDADAQAGVLVLVLLPVADHVGLAHGSTSPLQRDTSRVRAHHSATPV